MEGQKIQIWVRPLTAPRFRMEAVDSEKVASLRDRIVAKLKSSGLYIPAEAQLVLRGKVLQADLALSDCSISSTDQIVFLYDLTAKPPKEAPIPPPSPISTSAAVASTLPAATAAPLPRMVPAYQPVVVPNVAPAANLADPNNIRGMIGNFMANFNQRIGQQPAPGQAPAPAPAAQPVAAPVPAPVTQTPPPQTSTPPRVPQQPLPVPNQPVFVMNVPLPDRTALDEMLAMGFSEIRARRALLMNGLSVEEALDWLLIHGQAPHLDNPQLTPDEVRQILHQIEAMRQGHDEDDPMEEEQRASTGPTAEQRLRDAIANNRCTFSVTGRSYQMQAWYYCYTCGFVDSEGVCESCRAVCHKGHKVSERIKESTFFCDCGASGQCKCCTPPPNR